MLACGPARRHHVELVGTLNPPRIVCMIGSRRPGGVPMVATPQTLLVIMSDEHNRKIAGYAGHPIVGTPALDALAARGSRFTAAYTPSPICVPARASLATGLPVHR